MSSTPDRLTSDRKKPIKQWFQSFILIVCLSLLTSSALLAQENPSSVRVVRTLLPSEWNVPHPAGIAYSSQPPQLHLLEKTSIKISPLLGIDIVTITPQEHYVGTVHLDYVIGDAINVAFADDGARLFLLSKDAKQLAQVKVADSGFFDPATLINVDISWLSLIQPKGMSVDATGRYLYILDGFGPRLIQTRLLDNSGIDDSQVQIINLSRLGISSVRGVAIHPQTGHIFVASPNQQKLYEVAPSGKLATTYDLSTLSLIDQQAMVFARSTDLTDPAGVVHLFITDSNLPEPQPTAEATAPTSTPISTAPVGTPIATAPTSTPIATAPATSTAIATAPATSTPIATAPATATAIATAPTSTAIATAPGTSTAIAGGNTPTPHSTSTATATALPSTPTVVPTASLVPTPTSDQEDVLSTGRNLYLPVITAGLTQGEVKEIVAIDAIAAPIFGKVIEVVLE